MPCAAANSWPEVWPEGWSKYPELGLEAGVSGRSELPNGDPTHPVRPVRAANVPAPIKVRRLSMKNSRLADELAATALPATFVTLVGIEKPGRYAGDANARRRRFVDLRSYTDVHILRAEKRQHVKMALTAMHGTRWFTTVIIDRDRTVELRSLNRLIDLCAHRLHYPEPRREGDQNR